MFGIAARAATWRPPGPVSTGRLEAFHHVRLPPLPPPGAPWGSPCPIPYWGGEGGTHNQQPKNKRQGGAQSGQCVVPFWRFPHGWTMVDLLSAAGDGDALDAHCANSRQHCLARFVRRVTPPRRLYGRVLPAKSAEKVLRRGAGRGAHLTPSSPHRRRACPARSGTHHFPLVGEKNPKKQTPFAQLAANLCCFFFPAARW